MFKAPSQLPPLSLLIDDLPTRCLRQLARHLGISERTVKRYQEQDQAPRLVMLALFWETRWGQSVLDAEIFNRDQVQRGLVGALQRENAQLRATVARLVAAGDYGAANDPLWGVAACEGAKAGPAAIHRPASAAAAVRTGGVELVQQLGAHPARETLAPALPSSDVALQAISHQQLARPFQEQA
jgi:hypothetical protein